jgi:hypothetical protein
MVLILIERANDASSGFQIAEENVGDPDRTSAVPNHKTEGTNKVSSAISK